MERFHFGLLMGVIGWILQYNFTFAQDLSQNIDSGWILSNAYLVFYMQAGFAMLECGMVRAKNVKNIVLKNVVDTGVGSLCFFAVGFGFAFGTSGNPFIGTSDFLLLSRTRYDLWIFAWAFCATSATIASGSMAERTQFTSYIIYTAFVTLWVYPVVAHWVWAPVGWLHNLGDNGIIDYAGGTVVHLLGGSVGLVGAFVAGPRLGRFKEGSATEIPGHSSVLSALGAFLLWYGWYGFNTGSTKGLSGMKLQIAGRVAVNTTLAACSAGCTTLGFMRITTKKYDIVFLLNGILAGLVTSTSPCAVVEPYACIVIGFVAGFVLIGASKLLVKLKIDDPLDAAPVHMFCGIWGVFSTSLFATKENMEEVLGRAVDVYGLFYGGGFGQVWVQLVGILSVMGWSLFWSFLLFKLLDKFHLLRVEEFSELAGLDNTKHGGPAYPYFQMSELENGNV